MVYLKIHIVQQAHMEYTILQMQQLKLHLEPLNVIKVMEYIIIVQAQK